MISRRLTLCMLMVLLAVPFLVELANADTITSVDNFNVQILADDSLRIQDVSTGAEVTLLAEGSDWNASCSLATTDTTGTMIVSPTVSGNLKATANYENISITFNGVGFFGAAYPYSSGSSFTIAWSVPSGSGPVRLPTLQVKALWQYILEGDLLGFFQALFMYSFNSADLFYGVLAMVFCIPLYIRTKSLIFLCIVWIVLGGFFIALMPIVSGLALLFMALGIGGLIFKLVRSRYS